MIDFLMICPNADLVNYSQRVLLGVLEDAGFSVHLLNIPSIDGIVKSIEIEKRFVDLVDNSGVVGFGFMSPQYDDVKYLTGVIKAYFPDKPLVWGGPHCSIDPKCGNIGRYAPNLVFTGESDKTLLNYVKQGLDPFAYGDVVSDLDTLAMPFSDPSKQTLIDGFRVVTNPLYFKNSLNYMSMVGGRGCPFNCSYCANSHFKALFPRGVKYVRRHSAEYICKVIQRFRDEYAIRNVSLEDDLFFTQSDDELEKFVETYNRYHSGLMIGINGIAPSTVTQKKLDIISKLPIVHAKMGIQSMTETGQIIYDRKPANRNLDKSLNLFGKLYKRGILTTYDIILDNPFESSADYVQTLRLLNRIPKPFRLGLYHLMTYPGTKLYEDYGCPTDWNIGSFRTHTDTYINSLFKLVESTEGLIPGFIIRILSSLTAGERILKPIVDATIWIFQTVRFQSCVYRFFRLISGQYNREWAISKFGGCMCKK